MNNIASSIQYFKNQQWKILNYTVLMYGAVIAIKQYLNVINGYVKLGLFVLIISVCLTSIYFIQKFNEDLKESRELVDDIYKKNEINIENKKQDRIDFLLMCISIIGCSVTSIIIWWGKTV